MRCPKCGSTDFNLCHPCEQCQFTGDVLALERLSNLTFLLEELGTWSRIPHSVVHDLRQQYERRRRRAAVGLGLRPSPPTAAVAMTLRAELESLQAALAAIARWQRAGWLDTTVATATMQDMETRVAELTDQLLDTPASEPVFSTKAAAMHLLAQKRFVLDKAVLFHEQKQMSAAGYRAAVSLLEVEIEMLEVEAGLVNPTPLEEDLTPVEKPFKVGSATTAVRRRQFSRPAITWDRVWETLLSERTLQAILFLGVLLLFAAGISWVVWNWGTFTPAVQVAFLGGFTAVFYTLGWYVHQRMHLHGSGIALIAVGSLLGPLDFYAFYLSGGFPSGSWPLVWWGASVVCLVVYLGTAVLIQAAFFGYLIGLAAGSLVVASLNLVGVNQAWWSVGVAATAVALVLAGEWLQNRPGRWHIVSRPFGQIALAAVVPVMALGIGWGFLGPGRGRSFHMALAVDWWLGAWVLTWMVRRVRLQSLAWAAALSFPVAAWLTQRMLFMPMNIVPAWYALGWALLIPMYLILAWRWQHREDTVIYGRILRQVATLLVVLTAVWSLSAVQVAAAVHLLLAGTMVLTAVLWQQPRLLWGMSFFLLTATAAWQGGRGATPAELMLPWALLAVMHIVVGVWAEDRPLEMKVWSRFKLQVPITHYTAVLFSAGYFLAGLSLMPPLILYDQPLLAYALANWIGVNVWLAYLAHTGTAGVLAWLAHQWLARWRTTLCHWGAALAIVPWVWLLWSNGREPTPSLALVYTAVAWGLLWICTRVRRVRWVYGRAWQTAAHLSAVAALVVAWGAQQPFTLAVVLLWLAVFYFTVAWVGHNRRWLGVGGVLLPAGWALLLNTWGAPTRWLNPAVAAIVPGYFAFTGWWQWQRMERLKPLTDVALALTFTLASLNFWLMLTVAESDLVWVALSQLCLGGGLLIYAWSRQRVVWAYLGIWSGALAGGLLVKVYSHGSGRSAALAALLAVGLVLTERFLYQLAWQRGGWWRPAWRLYRRPLRLTGWLVSAGAMGLALGRNLIWLGGGVTQQTWTITALLLLVGLYALAARLYRRERFAWFAAVLMLVPWTMLTIRGWYVLPAPMLRWHGVSWLVLVLGFTAIITLLMRRLGYGWWRRPLWVTAHLIAPLALLWGFWDVPVSVVAVALGMVFYGSMIWLDAHFRQKTQPVRARFLYVVLFLLPAWAVYLLLWAWPAASLTAVGLLVLAFALPLLTAGRWVTRHEPAYRLPFYVLAYGTAVVGTLLVAESRPVLIGALLFDAGLAVLSVWLFRTPVWWYPGTVALPLAAALLLAEWGVTAGYAFGWLLIGIGGLYTVLAWVLTRRALAAYTPPLLLMMVFWTVFGLVLASETQFGAFVGYSLAALVLGATAVWWRWPAAFHLAVGLAVVPYITGWQLAGVAGVTLGLALWPGILLALALAHWLDGRCGVEPDETQPKLGAFPWSRPSAWLAALAQRGWRWWAWSLYGVALGGTAVSAALTFNSEWGWLLAVVWGTAVYTYALWRFWQRPWLLLAWGWLQLAALAFMRWLGWAQSPSQLALAFLPVTLITALAGLGVARWRQEAPLVVNGKLVMTGWSRPFYLLLGLNVGVGQVLALSGSGAGTAVTVTHGLLLAVLATAWSLSWFSAFPLGLGVVALAQFLAWQDVPFTLWPVALALLTLAYGLPGCWLRFQQHKLAQTAMWQQVWVRPLYLSGWFLSLFTLYLAAARVDVMALWVQLLWGDVWLLQLPAELLLVRVLLVTMALIGLLYLTAALVERWRWLGYGAVLMLLGSWCGWLFLLAEQSELQFYAMPAGFYLLGVGWAEWAWGSRRLARWVDRAALLLLLGSLFWQSFGPYGGVYALLMILEGLAIAWFGSMRRVRRLLYAGMAGVVVAVSGQLVEPLLNANTYVLLLLGGSLVALGIALERRLEKVRGFSKEMRGLLEYWE